MTSLERKAWNEGVRIALAIAFIAVAVNGIWFN